MINVLFIRGLTREVGHWRGFEKKFQLKNPNTHTMAIDLPGSGEFYQMTSPTHIDQYVYFMRTLYLKNKKDGPVILIAISMGGMIALRWGEMFPEDIAKIYVINTSVSNFSGLTKRFNIPRFIKILPKLFGKNIRKKEKAVLELTTNLFKITEVELDFFESILKKHPISLKSSIAQILAASQFKLTKPLIAPVVVISSLNDRLVSSECSKSLSENLNVPIVVHPTAGHDLPLDDPDWLLSELRL